MSSISSAEAQKFMHVSVNTQIDIAIRVRQSQNRDYVLYDADFHRSNRVLVNGYRVEVDALGRHAILNTASQKSISGLQYFGLVEKFSKDIIFIDNKVFLKAMPKIRSSIDSPIESSS